MSSLVLPSLSTIELPAVSVLLPCWRNATTIAACLDSLLAINWSDLEIIVCAGGDDETLEIARQYQGDRVIVLEQYPGEGKQGALRRCFESSTGEIIYLTDADCIVPNETFLAVISPIATGRVAAVTGTSWPVQEQRAEPFAVFQWSIVRAVERGRSEQSTGLLGRNCAVRRDALVRAGAFNEHVPIGTDYHLAKTLLAQGNEIRFVPAPVLTTYPTNAFDFVRQQSRWLRNIFLHGPRFGDRAELLACGRTITLGVGFFLWPLAWMWTGAAGAVLWLLAFGYLIAARARYGRSLAAETGSALGRSYLLRLPLYTLLDLVAWAWPLVEAMSRTRRLRW